MKSGHLRSGRGLVTERYAPVCKRRDASFPSELRLYLKDKGVRTLGRRQVCQTRSRGGLGALIHCRPPKVSIGAPLRLTVESRIEGSSGCLKESNLLGQVCLQLGCSDWSLGHGSNGVSQHRASESVGVVRGAR
jgi:hypothetical protein